MANEKIRVSAHSTMLKFGSMPDPKETASENSTVVSEAISKGIEAIGLHLTYAQDRALHAVQKLLDETDYLGNAMAVESQKSARYRFDEKLPVLEIKTADFLRAYGVKQTKTYRGKEFSPQARRVAIHGLRDLGINNYLLVYEKSYLLNPRTKKRKRWAKHLVEDVAPLLVLEIHKCGRMLKITPNPVLVDQIKTYFILKPDNFFEMVPKKDVVAARFLEYLLMQIQMKQRTAKRKINNPAIWEIRISALNMAYTLRLDAMLKARKKAALRERLEKLYQLGVRLGLLASYQTDQPGTKGRRVDVLRLNSLVPVGAKSTTSQSIISYPSEQPHRLQAMIPG